jgi:S-adenosylmethionine:tRNA ribosyltransferase-isomerase
MIDAKTLVKLESSTSAVNRLLHVDPVALTLTDYNLEELPTLLAPGDLLVVNDAATLPASLFGHLRSGEPIEVRLFGEQPGGAWRAVLFGGGDWRTPTENRPPPPRLRKGSKVLFGTDFIATVESVSTLSPRLVELRFDREGDGFWGALYRTGHPVQYAYEQEPLPLAKMQTPYATRPWAAEMPSAGRPLRMTLLAQIAHSGVRIATLTHAAGLSSTGDPAIDAALPLPERYEIPAATVDAIGAVRAAHGRVIAVGTTVVRALEGCAAEHDGTIVAGASLTDLVITRRYRPRIVDGLLSGIHAPDSSHFELLAAFLPAPLVTLYALHVAAGGYRGHEFGDSTLIIDSNRAPRSRL